IPGGAVTADFAQATVIQPFEVRALNDRRQWPAEGLPVIEQHNAMRPRPHRTINIVQEEYIKMTRPVRSRRQQLQDLNLVAQVKMIGRLVPKANWRILGEQGRDMDSPAVPRAK